MRTLPLAACAFLLVGCASTQPERPGATRGPWLEADFAAVPVEYLVSYADSVDLAALPARPRVRYVHHSQPGLVVPEAAPPLGEQAAFVAALAGPACPTRGTVYVGAVVGPDGAVHAAQVQSGIEAACDARAVRAVRLARVRPALLRGEPVGYYMIFPVRFE